jgi:hypothetical protein
VYAASIRSCRPCPLREQCQWQGNATAKPRQVSVLLHPLAVGVAPLLWRDWSRRQHRRACTQLHCQCLEIQREPDLPANSALSPPTLSRAERAHYRLGWQERLARPRTSRNFWSDHAHTVRYPRRRCHLARTSRGLTRPQQPLGSLSSDRLASPSADACASFPGCSSIALMFCSSRLPSCCFCHLPTVERSVR